MKPLNHLLLVLAVMPLLAFAHALPERTVPLANAVLNTPPAKVAIYFDTELEPQFSKLTVARENGEQVSEGDGQVDSANRKLLTARLMRATKGAYHVRWNVVARDGHRAKGEYTFSVK